MAMTQWELCRTETEQSKISMLLCDDDPDFLNAMDEELARIFRKLNLSASVYLIHSPQDLTAELLSRCDMAFFDIDYDNDDQNGIDIARNLRQVNSHALLFFVTNYIDYAPAGYEVQAFRYILKRDMRGVLERYLLQALDIVAEDRTVLRLRDKEITVDLPLDEITYLEVLDHYVSIHTASGDFTLNATLSGMECKLEGHGFLRIHKSFLVNMAHIRKFRSRECLLTDGTALAVSEKNYSQQKQKYLLWKGLK